MADISKCGTGCKRQDKCYRWTSQADPLRQYYTDYMPDDNGDCDGFKTNKGRGVLQYGE